MICNQNISYNKTSAVCKKKLFWKGRDSTDLVTMLKNPLKLAAFNITLDQRPLDLRRQVGIDIFQKISQSVPTLDSFRKATSRKSSSVRYPSLLKSSRRNATCEYKFPKKNRSSFIAGKIYWPPPCHQGSQYQDWWSRRYNTNNRDLLEQELAAERSCLKAFFLLHFYISNLIRREGRTSK